MYSVKIMRQGTSHCMVLPASILRALGWVRGDELGVYIKGGDVVVRNDSQRAARFTQNFRARKDQHVASELR